MRLHQNKGIITQGIAVSNLSSYLMQIQVNCKNKCNRKVDATKYGHKMDCLSLTDCR